MKETATHGRTRLSGRQVLALAFPYIVGVLIVLMMVHGALREDSTATFGDGENARDGSAAAGLAAGGVAASGRPELCPEGGERAGKLAASSGLTAEGAFVDPVCRMVVGRGIAASGAGTTRYFCAERCRELFLRDPEKYLAETCVVCRAEDVFVVADPSIGLAWEGKDYGFCSREHRDAFRADPAGYFLHSMWGIPSWLYYASIALVLLLSFVVFERSRSGATDRGPRIDLLRFRPLHWLVTRPQTRFVLQLLVTALFLLIIAAGLFGNQLPSKNVAPLLTWTVWWGGLVVLILYLGKAWCTVCPWDALAGWLESLRFWGRRRTGLGLGLAVPRFLRNIWPAIILFVFLTWIELGLGVTLKPRATAYLALAILGLAILCALVFDRRSFCRYGCLVGRISGLYALFSPIEVRSRDPHVCRTCTTHSCYKGNDQGNGCPTWQFPGTMPNNTYCTMCLECIRTCEPRNMTIYARPWGEDLKSVRRPRRDEAYLALFLLALTGFHGLTMTGVWRDVNEALRASTGIGETLGFSLGMAGLLAGPILIYAALVGLSRLLGGRGGPSYRDSFVRYSYSLLPIAFFYHLAHNAEHLLMEGQKVLALISDPFGHEWDLFGTASCDFAPLAGLSTLWGIQVFLVLIGHVYGLWAAHKVTARVYPDRRAGVLGQLPMLAAMILFSMFSLWLLKQPMEMRSSAM